jgi:uncharacterized protein
LELGGKSASRRGPRSSSQDILDHGIIIVPESEARMSGVEVPVAGVGFETLDDFLSSDRSPSDSMMLSDLDGFLTGVAIGRELIMPSEWLPIVWGDEEPVFADDREAQAVFGGIMSRYNEILRQVEDGTFQPVLWATSDDTVIAADWAEGFALAIGLRPKAWDPLFKAERHALLLFPILALCGDENGESVLGLDAEAEDEIMEETPAILPACVMGIAEFWRERRAGRSGNLRTDSVKAAARLARKPGRNDLCPCNSGKKFKKCCGRNS